jgi:hypothetical protein
MLINADIGSARSSGMNASLAVVTGCVMRWRRMAGVLLVSSAASAAHAQGPWYVSGSVGGYFRQSEPFDTTFFHIGSSGPAAAGSNRRDFDPGVIGALALGYRVNPRLRAEVEVSYAGYDVGSLHPSTPDASFNFHGQEFTRQSGGASTTGASANLFYDFPPVGKALTPYVGLGGGGAWTHLSGGAYAGPAGGVLHGAGGSSTAALALVEGGLSVAVGPRLSIVPAYRYSYIFTKNENVGHAVKVGLRYAF